MSIHARFHPRHHRRKVAVPITLLTVSENQCRYPMGDPSPEMPMCGAWSIAGAYCTKHRRIVYRTPRKPLEAIL